MVGSGAPDATAASSGTTDWLVSSISTDIGDFAVGDQGTIAFGNGLSWGVQTVGTARLNGIAYGGGILLAVGEGGAVARSTDGNHWTAGNAGVAGWLRGVLYQAEQKRFLVTGQGGTLLATSDGVTFIALNSGTTSDLECIASGGTPLTYVVAGADGYIAGVAGRAIVDARVPAGIRPFQGMRGGEKRGDLRRHRGDDLVFGPVQHQLADGVDRHDRRSLQRGHPTPPARRKPLANQAPSSFRFWPLRTRNPLRRRPSFPPWGGPSH